MLLCDGGKITMQGWVIDIKADGKCARVTGNFNGGISHQAKACPSGTTTYFSWTESGTLADGYLTVT